VRGRKPKFVVSLSEAERSELEHLVRRRQAPAGEVRRAKVVLLIADGKSLKETAEQTGFTVRNARKWIWRFAEKGREGLKEKSGRGRKPLFPPRSRLEGTQASL